MNIAEDEHVVAVAAFSDESEDDVELTSVPVDDSVDEFEESEEDEIEEEIDDSEDDSEDTLDDNGENPDDSDE